MLRSHTGGTVLLLCVGTIAGFALTARASDGGPALPASGEQPVLGEPAPIEKGTKTPAPNTTAKSPKSGTTAKSPKSGTTAPAAPAPGTVIAPVGPDAQSIPEPPAGRPAIPALKQFIGPDGSFILPGGVGSIQPGDDRVGIHINTPEGPLDFTVPRRRRATSGEEPPGSDGEAPQPGGRSTARASREFTVASRIFHARNYPVALRRVGRYLERDPGDRDLVQLRSLANFALADYPAAYRDALSALTDGEVWDWTTVRSLYRSAGEYTAQYRALEETVAANPNSPQAAFLFAYHNLMLGNREAARREFAHVAAIDPGNEMARRLATGERPPQPRGQTSGSSAASTNAGPAQSGPPAAAPRADSGPSVDFGQPAPPPK